MFTAHFADRRCTGPESIVDESLEIFTYSKLIAPA